MYDKKITVIFKYLTQLKQKISLEDKFYILIDMAKELIEVERCTIWRYDPSTQELIAKFAHGVDMELRESITTGVVGHCFCSKETIVMENPYGCELFDKHIDDLTGYKTNNIISIPIINSQNEVVGVFQALNKRTGDKKFHSDDLKLLDLVTVYMAEVFESTLLYENLAARVEEEIKKNKQKDEMLYEQAKIAALGDMIGNIAHQWRQPLSAISLLASSINLEHTMGILDPDSLPTKLESIIQKSHYLSNTIETFRDFVKNDKIYKDVDLYNEISQAIDIVTTLLNDYDISLHYSTPKESSIILKSASGELQQVIINIINNARDALLENNISNPWIKIASICDTKYCIITIEDNGGGIPHEIINRIFEPYFTTKHQSQGTGLGLHICYRIITESMKGNLYVKNTQVGAKFFIEIPY